MMVAAVQLSSQGDVPGNLERVAHLVREAGRRGADLVVLPENFAYMGDDEGKRGIAESLDGATNGPIAAALAGLARKHSVELIAGGMPERSDEPDRPYNTSVAFARTGAIVARYRKIHLFDVDTADGTSYRESVATTSGEVPVVAACDGVTVGMTICYDLRFPELFRALADQGARVATVPAAFTLMTGKDHWHVLLRARAIENALYVVAPAQHGRHARGRQTYGKSAIVDPWGDVVAQCSDGEGIAVAQLDFALQDRVRRDLPSLRHRKLP